MKSKHERAVEALAGKPWAQGLLQRIDEQGGVGGAPAGLLFELRFAFELALYCPTGTPRYEVDAGVEGCTVDFELVSGGRRWLIELVSLMESRPVRAMRSESCLEIAPGITSESICLRSDSSDREPCPRRWARARQIVSGSRAEGTSESAKREGQCLTHR
jgi:hypothetical protein